MDIRLLIRSLRRVEGLSKADATTRATSIKHLEKLTGMNQQEAITVINKRACKHHYDMRYVWSDDRTTSVCKYICVFCDHALPGAVYE
jgi:hypothetical protein